MPLLDISRSLDSNTPTYPGDPKLDVVRHRTDYPDGSVVSSQLQHFGTHTGTHLDAPSHFRTGGATIDHLDLARCFGPAIVVAANEIVTPEMVPMFESGTSVLFDTNERGYLDPAAAELLVARGANFVGIDSLSVDPIGELFPSHLALLAAGVLPLENLDLTAASPGHYHLTVLPLRITDGDGAPVRAVLSTD